MLNINLVQIYKLYPHFLQFVRKPIPPSNFLGVYVHEFYFIIQLSFYQILRTFETVSHTSFLGYIDLYEFAHFYCN